MTRAAPARRLREYKGGSPGWAAFVAFICKLACMTARKLACMHNAGHSTSRTLSARSSCAVSNKGKPMMPLWLPLMLWMHAAIRPWMA